MKIDDLHPIRWPDEHKKRPAILALARFARADMAQGHAGAGDEFRDDVHNELAKGFGRGPEAKLLADPLFFTSVLKAECVSALKVDQFMSAGANVVVVPRQMAEALDGAPSDLTVSDLSCPMPCLYMAFQDSPFEWMDIHGEPAIVEGCYVSAGRKDVFAGPDNGWEHLSLYFMVRPTNSSVWPKGAATGIMLTVDRANPAANVSDVIDREVDRIVGQIRATVLRQRPRSDSAIDMADFAETAILQQNERRYVEGSARAKRALMTIFGALHALTVESPAEPKFDARVSPRLRRALLSNDENARREARAEMARKGFVNLMVLERIPEVSAPLRP